MDKVDEREFVGDSTPAGAPEPDGLTLEQEVQASEPTGQQRGLWRSWILPLIAVALIGAAIWYLQSRPALPFLDKPAGSGRSQGIQNADFVSFESQGIKLGAAGGSAPKIGEAAPDFTLLDLSGNLVRLSDFRGKTVVMNFWATWCPPCRKEFPELVKVYDKNADRGLVVLGMNLRESPDIVRDFANQFGAKFPIVIDFNGEVFSQYRVLSLPETYFIDSQGIVRGHHVGLLTEDTLARKLGEAGFTLVRSP